MSGLFGSTTIKGNRITDFAQTTATIGVPLPFGYGRFVVEGNIIYALLPPKEKKHRKKQGKGGVKTETYTYSTNYAVAFAQRIYGFWWIKRNGKVVYTQDPKAPIEDRQFAQQWMKKATLYLGTEEQLPDSTIESKEGAGNVSAFRGVSYIVLEDDDVTDGGGAIPSYTACVIASPPVTYVTSRPYPVLEIPSFDEIVELRRGGFGAAPRTVEGADTNAALLGGGLADILKVYPIPPEALDTSVVLQSGSLPDVLKTYAVPPESLNTTVAIQSGLLDEVLLRYTYPPESLNTTVAILGGSLA